MANAAERLASGVTSAAVLARSGIIRPYSPRTLLRLGRTLKEWGTGPAGGFTSLALRWPDRVGLIDDLGPLTFGEVHRRSNALAASLKARGVGEGDSVAVMCRNHRGFVDISLAVAKLGADVLYLNTAFAGPQLVDVLEREKPTFVVHDEEFTELLQNAEAHDRLLAWVDSNETDLPDGIETIEQLIAKGQADDLEPPNRHGRIVILTSGTTGTPKGAPRNEAGIDAAVSLLSRMPLRAGWKTHIAAPLFHTWGYAHLALGMLLGSTVVLTRRFDPEGVLAVAERHRCDSLVVIPVMLQRILQLPDETLDRHDLSTIKAVAASGSAMPGDLATTWMDRFGDTLYNVYGSTEVAYATVATPQDLREAPGTAGKPPHATVVRIVGEDGKPVPTGESGRIFVGNGLLFEGYTGGGHKDMIDGLMSSGDVGRFDEDGRLFIEGRDDEMIVSGGENVFPKEVEDCLVRHEAVDDAAALGVDDDEYGKRLRAFVVTRKNISEDDLKAWVKSNLARYKVPREIVFLDELPRNSTGKVLKRELAEHESAED
ncbi:MAG: AMP-binding protein [Nocardioides sp.]